jgi:hypothetical protein
MDSKLTPEELDYGAPKSQLWGMDEAGPSTGWDTTEDTAPAIAVTVLTGRSLTQRL